MRRQSERYVTWWKPWCPQLAELAAQALEEFQQAAEPPPDPAARDVGPEVPPEERKPRS